MTVFNISSPSTNAAASLDGRSEGGSFSRSSLPGREASKADRALSSSNFLELVAGVDDASVDVVVRVVIVNLTSFANRHYGNDAVGNRRQINKPVIWNSVREVDEP